MFVKDEEADHDGGNGSKEQPSSPHHRQLISTKQDRQPRERCKCVQRDNEKTGRHRWGKRPPLREIFRVREQECGQKQPYIRGDGTQKSHVIMLPYRHMHAFILALRQAQCEQAYS